MRVNFQNWIKSYQIKFETVAFYNLQNEPILPLLTSPFVDFGQKIAFLKDKKNLIFSVKLYKVAWFHVA